MDGNYRRYFVSRIAPPERREGRDENNWNSVAGALISGSSRDQLLHRERGGERGGRFNLEFRRKASRFWGLPYMTSAQRGEPRRAKNAQNLGRNPSTNSRNVADMEWKGSKIPTICGCHIWSPLGLHSRARVVALVRKGEQR